MRTAGHWLSARELQTPATPKGKGEPGVTPACALSSPTWHRLAGPEPGGGNGVHQNGPGDEPNPGAIQGAQISEKRCRSRHGA